jgi:hypothetical protein
LCDFRSSRRGLAPTRSVWLGALVAALLFNTACRADTCIRDIVLENDIDFAIKSFFYLRDNWSSQDLLAGHRRVTHGQQDSITLEGDGLPFTFLVILGNGRRIQADVKDLCRRSRIFIINDNDGEPVMNVQ